MKRQLATFDVLYEKLLPEHKVMFFALFDDVTHGIRSVIRNRATENAVIVLSYAGLIAAYDRKGEFPVVTTIKARGINFMDYLKERTSLKKEMTRLPNGHPLKTRPLA